METKDSSRRPRRKTRKTPITDRERGLDAIIRDGRFVLPMDAKRAGPITYWLNRMSVTLYNLVGDLMMIKVNLSMGLDEAEGAKLTVLKAALTTVNKRIRRIRKQAYKLRKYVLEVEEDSPINEPLNWARE